MYSESERAHSELKDKVDIVFGLTHLEIEQDIELLKIIPEIPLIIGGHDHNSMSVSVGKSKITKADANAKTIYIHTLVYNIKTKDVVIDSELFFINKKIASKPEVATIVNKWLGILNSKIKAENRVQELSQITRSLKRIAKEFQTPIIALSQLSRNVENRVNKRPILSDLRESGSIEQDADLVFMLYRENYYNSTVETITPAELIVAKHRNGPLGTIKLSFQTDPTRFFNTFSHV